jgi:hypothetical protein
MAFVVRITNNERKIVFINISRNIYKALRWQTDFNSLRQIARHWVIHRSDDRFFRFNPIKIRLISFNPSSQIPFSIQAQRNPISAKIYQYPCLCLLTHSAPWLHPHIQLYSEPFRFHPYVRAGMIVNDSHGWILSVCKRTYLRLIHLPRLESGKFSFNIRKPE